MSLKNELHLMKAKRQELINKNKSLEVVSEGSIILIRSLTNPYQQKLIKMKTEDILESAKQLDKTIKAMRENQEQIDQITEELGDGEDC
ncbi:MAG: hypothetical protein HY817_01510 [Candidatus Abawacabacteria bacterium]|nr:hypothetical protein [Candidatus Abawacabacteria bacterium]